jgi:hypothetical protein
MTPPQWLQFTPMQTPQLGARPSPMESLGQLGAGLINQHAQRQQHPNGPRDLHVKQRNEAQIAKQSGVAASGDMGAPPVLRRRQFPNAQQASQLDNMVGGGAGGVY